MINTSTNISSVSHSFLFFDVIQSCFVNIVLSYTAEFDKFCVVFPVVKDYILINFTHDTDINSV